MSGGPHRAWKARAEAIVAGGGAKAGEVDSLIASANQFLWGSKDVCEGVAELQERLRDAKDWLSKVTPLHPHLRPTILQVAMSPILGWVAAVSCVRCSPALALFPACVPTFLPAVISCWHVLHHRRSRSVLLPVAGPA